MRQELDPEAIIHIGYRHEVRQQWARVQYVAQALFGPAVGPVTLCVLETPQDDHYLRGLQIVATDLAGRVLPYDFTTAWWAQWSLREAQHRQYATAHLTDMSTAIGNAFPPDIRDGLRRLCEEQLGVEFLHAWETSESVTWSFDCQMPPSVATQPIFAETGDALPVEALITAGREYSRWRQWAQVREYVHTLYGPRAATAKVIQFSRYNDSRYDRDVRLEVRAADHARLYYDLHLPWWERYQLSDNYIASYEDDHQGESTDSYEESDGADLNYHEEFNPEQPRADVQRLAQLLLRADFAETPEALESDVQTYDFTAPPPLTYPRLWIEADAAPTE